MNDLKNSGLNLRSINLVDYSQLVEDLQYNFTQILNLPGFKGMPGESIVGETGIGVRGSKWVFVTLDDIRSAYPSVTSIEQITLAWVNSSFNDDPTKLFESIYIPGDDSLLIGDILVLPSGQLISLSEITVDSVTNIVFVDTGITFAQVSSITENRVIELFNQMYGGINTSTSALRHFDAVAKNGADTSPALNNDMNQDSAIDIVTAGSGPGVPLPGHTFVAATEQAVGVTTKMCFIAGSPKKYHELIQATQTIHTNNYSPGIDDFASGVFLQNSYSNGIIFGNAEAESIRQFGRLFRSVDSTVLTSSYSPFDNEFSELRLYDNQALIRAISATMNVTTLDVLAQTYNSKMFSFAGSTAQLANSAGASLEIYAPAGTYLKNITSASFLSTDATGKILKTYSLINTLSGTLNSSQIVDALTLQNAFATINTTLASYNTRLLALENADGSKFFQKLAWQTTTTNFNTLVDNGNYIIKSGVNISNFVTGVTTAPTDMIVNSFVSSIDATNMRVLQEVTMSGSTEFSLYMNGIKWFRIGSKTGAGAWTFTQWSKTVTGNDKVDADGALQATGSFNTGNMKIVHKGKAAGLNSSTNSGQTVIRNLIFDDYGHVMGYESTSITTSTLMSVVSYLYSWTKDRIYGNIANPAPSNATIISITPYAECRTADVGYLPGDIATVSSPNYVDYPQAPTNAIRYYDGGVGVKYKATGGGNISVMIGDRVHIRRNDNVLVGSGSSSPPINDVSDIDPNKWYIRLVTIYSLAANEIVFVPDTTPPSVPADFAATVYADGSVSSGPAYIMMGWLDSTDTGTSGLAGYEVHKSLSASGPYTLFATTSMTTMYDMTVSYDMTYYYKVRSFDGASNYSAFSDYIEVIIPVDPDA